MIVRVAMFDAAPAEWTGPQFDDFRKWMASQPGFVTGQHLKNPATGAGMSISYWRTQEEMAAMKNRSFPGGPMGIHPRSVDIWETLGEFETR